MGRTISLSDEEFTVAERLALDRGISPEQLIQTLLDEAWEAECARYDDAFENDVGWQESARAAEAGESPEGTIYRSTAEFLRALGASEEEQEAARWEDARDKAGRSDADVRG